MTIIIRYKFRRIDDNKTVSACVPLRRRRGRAVKFDRYYRSRETFPALGAARERAGRDIFIRQKMSEGRQMAAERGEGRGEGGKDEKRKRRQCSPRAIVLPGEPVCARGRIYWTRDKFRVPAGMDPGQRRRAAETATTRRRDRTGDGAAARGRAGAVKSREVQRQSRLKLEERGCSVIAAIGPRNFLSARGEARATSRKRLGRGNSSAVARSD